MKLPAIIKGDTATKLARAEEDLAACDAKLADLAGQREQVLAGDAAVEEILAIDHQAEKEQRKLLLLQNKVALLSDRQAAEARNAAAAARSAAIAKAETTILPARMAAIEALAKWARDGLNLVEKLEAASKLKGWPDDCEKPYIDDVRPDRILRAISAAFSGLGSDWHPARGLEIIDDAVANEAAHHAQAIAELKRQPEPEQEAA